MARCGHRSLEVKSEKDGCYWVKCNGCRKRGPKKHSHMLALMAFAMSTVNGHPRT